MTNTGKKANPLMAWGIKKGDEIYFVHMDKIICMLKRAWHIKEDLKVIHVKIEEV